MRGKEGLDLLCGEMMRLAQGRSVLEEASESNVLRQEYSLQGGGRAVRGEIWLHKKRGVIDAAFDHGQADSHVF